MLAGSVSGSAPDKLSAYAYEDTRRLIALVEEAAKLMEEEGAAGQGNGLSLERGIEINRVTLVHVGQRLAQ